MVATTLHGKEDIEVFIEIECPHMFETFKDMLSDRLQELSQHGSFYNIDLMLTNDGRGLEDEFDSDTFFVFCIFHVDHANSVVETLDIWILDFKKLTLTIGILPKDVKH